MYVYLANSPKGARSNDLQGSSFKPRKNEIVIRAFDAITVAVNKLSIYITFWTDFQSLWDLQPEVLYERLGEDLEK
jgi:dynein heavy chain 1